MPVKLEYTSDRGVIFKGSGVMTGSETVALNAELIDTILGGRVIQYQLVDLTEIEDFALSSDEMKTLAQQDTEILKHSPMMVIALAVSDSAAYGLMRMYGSYVEAYSGSKNTSLFKTVDEAREWIETKLHDRPSA